MDNEVKIIIRASFLVGDFNMFLVTLGEQGLWAVIML